MPGIATKLLYKRNHCLKIRYNRLVNVNIIYLTIRNLNGVTMSKISSGTLSIFSRAKKL